MHSIKGDTEAKLRRELGKPQTEPGSPVLAKGAVSTISPSLARAPRIQMVQLLEEHRSPETSPLRVTQA